MQDKHGETTPQFIEKGCTECGGYVKAPYKVCWKCKNENPPPDPRQEQIQWGQSFNLAAQMVCGLPLVDSKKQDEIEKWQKWFYRKLTRKPSKDGGKPSLLKKKYQTEANEKAGMDAIEDFGEEHN